MRIPIRRGSEHASAKITESQARQIKIEYRDGKRGSTEAKRFGLSPERYNKIGQGIGWAHVRIEE